jgi:soluble lytic murein transglycosylase
MPLEKKRLHDLYQIELKNLKSTSPRAQDLEKKISVLKPEIESLLVSKLYPEVDKAEKEKPKSEKVSFSNDDLKKQMQEAYQAWNQDQNLRALELIERTLESTAFKDQAKSKEKIRVFNLWFRIAFDLRDFGRASQAYQALKKESECDPEASQAAFQLALIQFAEGKKEEARQLMTTQCDSDNSLANRNKRTYWLFRMAEEGSPERKKYYEELVQQALPGYYTYLATSFIGQDFNLPKKQTAVSKVFEAPSKAHELIQNAEGRLRVGLRKDASKLLLLAKMEIIGDAEKYQQALLYISRLFQASGNHLEAMKILNSLLTGEDRKRSPLIGEETLSEFMALYHQPFKEPVEWLAKTWAVDPDFIYSIMRQESAFNPGAVSVAGARGLMQLMPTLSKFLVEQWCSPYPMSLGYLFKGSENIRLATYHLNQLNRLAPHPALVAAAYNAGINRTINWWRRSGQYPLDVFVELIPIQETRNYVKLVLRNLIYYKGQKNQGQVPKEIFAMALPTAPYQKVARTFGIHQ